MTDKWTEATFEGAARARLRRLAGLSPQQRLRWLEAALADAERAGVLTALRARRDRELLAWWAGGGGPRP